MNGERSGGRQEKAAAPPDPPASRFRLIRHPLFLFALCVLAAVLIRFFVVEGYTVPTDSMEPLLHGDKEEGDKVAVFKLYYSLFDPERFDVVVFSLDRDLVGEQERLIDDGEKVNVVKRVVGLPGEKIGIRDGDIWVGRNEPKLLRKNLDQILAMLIPVYRSDCGRSFFNEWNGFTIENGKRKAVDATRSGCLGIEENVLVCNASLPGTRGHDVCLSFGTTEITDIYLDDQNEPQGGAFTGIRDLCLSLDCEIASPGKGALVGSLLEGVDLFRFELNTRQAGGGGRLIHEVRNTEVKSLPLSTFPGFETGERVRIRFMNVDNQVLLLVDGEVIGRFEYECNSDPGEIGNNPSFGARGVEALFHRVEIDRDIHYLSRGAHGGAGPFSVPENSFFFLGDNSSESTDSRHYGAVPGEEIIGKPFLIFSPLPRFRFL